MTVPVYLVPPTILFSDIHNNQLWTDDEMVSVAAKASLRKEMKVVLKGLSKEARWFVFLLSWLLCFPFQCCSEHSVPPLSSLPCFMLSEQSSLKTWWDGNKIRFQPNSFLQDSWKYLLYLLRWFLDTQVSLAPTHVSKLVGKLVTLSDFQSLVSNGRSNKKSSKNKVHLFSNFASGRILPTHKNVYEGLNAWKCIWRLKCSKM